MIDEVKIATNRLIGYSENVEECGWPNLAARDRGAIAAGIILAKHLATDATEVTQEWLLQHDFLPDRVDPRWQLAHARLDLDNHGKKLAVAVAKDGHVAIAVVGQFGDTTTLLEGALTTEHIRRFCEAFGHPIPG